MNGPPWNKRVIIKEQLEQPLDSSAVYVALTLVPVLHCFLLYCTCVAVQWMCFGKCSSWLSVIALQLDQDSDLVCWVAKNTCQHND